MEVKVLQIEVAKETAELGEGLAKFIIAVKTALANGWQLGEDMPVIIASAVSDMVPAIIGVEKIAEEVKESPVKAALGLQLSLMPVVESFLPKKEVVSEPQA